MITNAVLNSYKTTILLVDKTLIRQGGLRLNKITKHNNHNHVNEAHDEQHHHPNNDSDHQEHIHGDQSATKQEDHHDH